MILATASQQTLSLNHASQLMSGAAVTFFTHMVDDLLNRKLGLIWGLRKCRNNGALSWLENANYGMFVVHSAMLSPFPS
jgi:hypothetical protein